MEAAPIAAEQELVSPPTDGVSGLAFSPDSRFLLVSSWDKTCRLYDAVENVLRSTFTHDAPVLCCTFSTSTEGFGGGLDKTLRCYNFNTDSMAVVGTHDDAIKSVVYSQDFGVVISGGWDKKIKIWDATTKECQGEQQLPDKVYAMSLSKNRLVVATAARHIWVFNLDDMSTVFQRRESMLKYQTRTVCVMPDAQGFVTASIEGRVSLEYFDTSEEAQQKKFTFKCHRNKEGGVQKVYPINAIAFHPIFGTFASGGCDGLVNVWDGNNRKRLYQFHQYPTSIASLAFSPSGTMLAIAVSYTYEEGDKEHPPDQIVIRPVTAEQMQPKMVS
eukprot:m.360521 g.360521  ORF g.360521 m.360521 type:complete len:330 (-) comp19081_c0_seq1:361-1350(-)